MTTLALSGLVIIGLSWVLQLLHAWKHGKSLSDVFILTYGIGTALILTDSTQGGFSVWAWLHALILLLVALVYVRIHRK